MENITKFGDVIFLQIDKTLTLLADQNMSDKHEFGFLGSNSFVCPRLWVRFLEGANPKNFDVNTILKNNKSFDHKDCMFVILPKLKYRYHKQKQKIEQNINALIKRIESMMQAIRIKKISGGMQNSNLIRNENGDNFLPNSNQKESSEHQLKENSDKAKHSRLETILSIERQRLVEIEQNCIEETRCNQELIMKMSGKPVHYSKSLCLQHSISKYFVTFSTASAIKNQDMKAILVPILKKKCYLEFVPKLRYRNPKSYIYYNDEILIKSKKKDLNLMFLSPKVPFMDLEFYQFFIRKNMSYDNNVFNTHKCCFADGNQNDHNVFKILFYQKEIPQVSQILAGDLVRIKSIDLNAYLQADLCYNNFQMAVEDLFLIQKENHMMSSKDCIWEINHLNDRKEISSQVVKNKGKETDVVHNTSPQIYLKHFFLGRVMSNLNDSLVVNNNHSKHLPLKEFHRGGSIKKQKRLIPNLSPNRSNNILSSHSRASSQITISDTSPVSSRDGFPDSKNIKNEENKEIILKNLERVPAGQETLARIENKWVKEILDYHNFEKLEQVPMMPNLLKNRENDGAMKKSHILFQNRKSKTSKAKSRSENSEESSSSSGEDENVLNRQESRPKSVKDSFSNDRRRKYQSSNIKKSNFMTGYRQTNEMQEDDLRECLVEFQSNFENINILNENVTYFIIFDSQFFSFQKKSTIKAAYGNEAHIRLTLNQNRFNNGLPKNQFSCIETNKNFTIPNIIEDSYKHKSIVLLTRNENSRCNFQLEKISKKDIQDLYFAKSFLYFLYKLRNKLYTKNLKGKLLKNRLEEVSNMLSRFLNHLSTDIKGVNSNGFMPSQVIDSDNQILLKEYTAIEVLTDILYLANFNIGTLNQPNIMNSTLLYELSKTTIDILKMIVIRNNQNVVHCSRWYEMLVKLIIKSAKNGLTLDVEDLVLNMLKQNGSIIRSKANNNSIEKFILLTLAYRNFMHIKILRKLISHNGKLNERNQREVTLLLLKDDGRLSKFLLEINERHGRYSFKMPLLNWDDMEPNDLISEEHSGMVKTNEYQFFFQSIKLLCDLCKQRNYLAIDLLRKRFAFDKLIGLINYLNTNNLQLKAVFINLLRLTYVNIFGFDSSAYKTTLKFVVNDNIVISELKEMIWYSKLSEKSEKEYQYNNKLQLIKTDKWKTRDNDVESNNFLGRVDKRRAGRLKSVFINDIDAKNIEFQEVYDSKFCINPQNRLLTIERLIDFISQNLDFLVANSTSTDTNQSFLDLMISVLKFLTFLLKSEIIDFGLIRKFYKDAYKLWHRFEHGKFVELDIPVNNRQWRNKTTIQKNFQIRKKFLKLFKVFLHQDILSYFSELYQNNRHNLNKKSILQEFSQEIDSSKIFVFIKPAKMVFFMSQLLKYDEFKDKKLHATIVQTLYKLLSPFSTFDQDFVTSTFVKDNHLTVYRSMLEISYSIERLAENCQSWILDENEVQMNAFQDILFRISLILIKARMAPSKMSISNFMFTYDSNDMKHLKILSDIVNDRHLVYYINFFRNSNSNSIFSFIQEINCSLPVFTSLIMILKEFTNHLDNVSKSMKKIIKVIYFCIAAMTFENEKCCENFHSFPQDLLFELFEVDSDFCIVLYNYVCWNKDFIDLIFKTNNENMKMITLIVKHIVKEKEIAVKSFCLNILIKFFSIKALKRFKKTQRQLYFYVYVKLKDLLVDNLRKLNESNEKYYANFEFDAKTIHNTNVKMIKDNICLSLTIISLLIKISEGKKSLSKIVVQQFFSLKFIAKILNSNYVWFYAKQKHIKIISNVYSFKDNRSSMYFHEILEEIWMTLIDLLIKEITTLDEKKIQYVSFNYLLTFKSANCMEMKRKYITKIIGIIFEIIKNFYEFKFKDVDSITFFQGLKRLLEFTGSYTEFNVFKTEFENITDFVIENWKPGVLQNQNEIEQLLSMKLVSNGKDHSHHNKASFHVLSDPEINFSQSKNLLDDSILANNSQIFVSNQHSKVRKSFTDRINSPAKLNQVSRNLTIQQTAPFSQSPKVRISFSINKDFQYYIEADYKLIYNFLKHFKYNRGHEYMKLTIIENVIECVHSGCFRKNVNADTIKSLKLIRYYIEDEVEGNIESFKWNADILKKYQIKIASKQNDLVEIKVIELIIYLVENESSKIKIFNETMKLGIAVLFGGNKKAQSKFLSVICSNSNSKFLKTIHEIIEEHIEILRPRFEECYIYYIKNFIDTNYKSFRDIKAPNTNKKIETMNLTFRFLQLLCEGHNSSLQVYLLDQSRSSKEHITKNFNFIESALNALGIMVKFLNPLVIHDCEQIVDFLIECVQGPCAENQEFLLRSRLMDYANDAFLELFNEIQSDIKGYYNSQNIKQVNIFVMKFVRLFMSLLEADNNKQAQVMIKNGLELNYLVTHLNKGLREWLLKNFGEKSSYIRDFINRSDSNKLKNKEDLQFINRTFTQRNNRLYQKSVTPKKKPAEPRSNDTLNFDTLLQMFNFMTFDEEIRSLFEVYILLKNLLKKNEIKALNSDNDLTISFFSHFTGKIQICFKNNLYKNYFIIHPCCFYIEKYLLDRMMRNINRSTPINKVSDLVDLSFRFFLQIEQQFYLNSKLKRFGINSKIFTVTKKLVTIFGVVINLLLLFLFEKKIVNSQMVDGIVSQDDHIIIILVGYVLFILLILKIILYIAFRGRTKFLLHMTRYENLLLTKTINPDNFENVVSLRFIHHEYPKAKLLKVLSQYLEYHKYKISPNFFYKYKQIEYFTNDNTIRNSLMFLTLVILGVFMKYTFLYAFLLLDLVQYFAVLRNIFHAISKNSRLLFLTTFLILLVVYLYSVFGYIYLNGDFYMSDPAESACESIFHCFLTIINFAPRSTGSIGDVIQWPSFGNSSHYFVRWFFDFSIWLLINLICQNILLGIIIDTFAELDEQKKLISDDIQNTCSICSINKTVFDKYTKGFKHHVNVEHKIEHYMYFIYYLKYKEETDLTGIESYIKNAIKYKDVSWVPIMRARSVEKVMAYQNNKSNV